MYPWNFPANFLVLRIISFNVDSYNAYNNNKKNDNSKKEKILDSPLEEDISQNSHSSEEYNLISFLAYSLYPPLYIAGPIITFNSYLYYTKKRQDKESKTSYFYLTSISCHSLIPAFSFSSLLISSSLPSSSPSNSC